MATITLVTGNAGKLRELTALAPTELDIIMKALDLAEIQSLSPREIVEDKLQRAYAIVQGPVIVEDVAAGLDSLGGLPGPFFKFFEKILGQEALLKLAHVPNERATITCVAGYYDGDSVLFGEGVIHGIVVPMRGSNGFGFDPVIVPDGHSRTMAEMSVDEKNTISHRAQAFKALLAQLPAA
jgi:non-canonical purine NTP pyrophosphatase (RdgB/HAM1 family)